MSSPKAHKDFLDLTRTQGDARLHLTYNRHEKYRIILQLYVNVNAEWQDARLLYRSNSFVEANAVWLHLTKQDHKVWRMTQFDWLA